MVCNFYRQLLFIPKQKIYNNATFAKITSPLLSDSKHKGGHFMNFKRQSFWKGKKMVVTDIGKRIRLAREIAGFTQENLAEAVDVSRTAVARWESGDIVPNLQHIVDIAMLLNVSTDYLLGVKGSDENKLPELSEKAVFALTKFIKEVKEVP